MGAMTLRAKEAVSRVRASAKRKTAETKMTITTGAMLGAAGAGILAEKMPTVGGVPSEVIPGAILLGVALTGSGGKMGSDLALGLSLGMLLPLIRDTAADATANYS